MSNHRLRNNTKLHLVKGRFKRCLTIFSDVRKDSVSDLIQILDRDLQKGMQESYWRLIWWICICCIHSRHSQGFKGYCETKRIIPVIPREPGWYQEKVLWCCTLFFTSLFTFYDVVHFSRLCKSWSFFDWSFSRLQHPWSWLRSRLILLGFRELNKLQFPLMVLPFSQRFPVIYSLCFPLQESLYPIRPIKVFLVRWDLFDLF